MDLRRLIPLAAIALMAAPFLAAPAGAQPPAAPAARPAPPPPIVSGPPKSFKPTMAVPNPTVTGPIAVKGKPGDATHDYPWMSTMHNLAAAGYVEEEFFFDGTARQFTTGANPQLSPETAKYRSRILIRRPKDMKKFNGAVLAEWQNVTAGYDLDAMWNGAFEHITRNGYVWAGITSQRIGVEGNATEKNGLRLWSPARYGTLNIINDNYSYDIFAQGMQAIKNPKGVNVLGGVTPKTVVAMGASQSAGRLGTYINSLHPYLGGPVDAYLIMIGGSLMRDDMSVPVFSLYSETEIRAGAQKADTDMYRHWEVAGASHSTRRSAMNSGPLTRRDSAQRPPPACTYPTWPRVPMNAVLGAVYDGVSRWAHDGPAPAKAPLVQRDAAGPVRDARGNVLGGIRLAEFDPAVALNSRDNAGTQFCNLYGRYQPFSDAVIAQLYPTHGAYVSAAKARNAANLKAGYIVAADARVSDQRAEESIFGYGYPCAAACLAGQDLVDSTYFYLGLDPRRDQFGSRMAGIVRGIAAGDKAGGAAKAAADAKARRDIEKWVADLSALAGKGAISQTILAELGTGANAVLKGLPAG
ncbi:hypothetical protein BH11PSE2_BH11PSE2_21540 [soil metagenome]